MAHKNRTFLGFLRKKLVLRKKVYFDELHAIVGAWAHFRGTHYFWALCKRLSARSRGAMAVAPMFSFFKTNEVTDFISFISWLLPTATLM